MLKNYLLITVRNLFKNKTYSFINIAGLSIGIACTLLIMLWVFDELSFDRFLPKSDRLYQVRINAHYDGKISSWTSVPLPLGEGLKPESSYIANTTMTDWGGNRLLTIGENKFNKRSFFVGREFLTMFEFTMVQGDPNTALADVYSIVITESTAKALFGDEDPMNKTVRFEDRDELKVTGVVKDVPKNSSFQFDYLLPWKLYETREWVKNNLDNWGNNSFQCFMELNDPARKEEVESKIVDLLSRKGETEFKKELTLHPLLRWRLHSNFENGKESGGMIDYVNMFSVIATFILIIACINFMNLSTARSERRAREVGIRKSVGSVRREIIFQFMGESLFIALIAFALALVMAHLALPFYNQLVEKQLAIDYRSPLFWTFTFGLIFFTGVISGSYPAFYLSSFQPATVLKGKMQAGKKGSLPRKILVTAQFGFSILLIIGTMVIYEQIQLVKNRDLGYKQENLISVWYTTAISENYEVIKEELLQSGVVSSVTRSNSTITQINSNNFLGWPGKPEELRVNFATIAADYDYTQTMGIKVLMGRDFSRDFKSDTSAVLINKAGLDLMNLEEPIGTQLDLWGRKVTLVGVLDNVLMGSPYTPVGPMFVILDPQWINAVTIRLEPTSDLPGSVKKVEEIFKRHNPAYPFEYNFADVEFAKKFKNIDMTSALAKIFAGLAVFITGLGLFGLAAFTAEQRTKEIGIRKVLGASVPGLVGLMSKDFSRLVIIAFFVTVPFAWWLLDMYLQQYKYRITIPWWIFPLTGIIALTFALIIVSTQALRAANANPVKSLRNE